MPRGSVLSLKLEKQGKSWAEEQVLRAPARAFPMVICHVLGHCARKASGTHCPERLIYRYGWAYHDG